MSKIKYTETNLQIFKTKNYEIFKFLDFNREIKKNSYLEEDILNCNKLKYHPITVDRDFNIVDGQHRLKIAEKNDLEIYFMIDLDATGEEINKVQNAKIWSQWDWLNYYCKKGNRDYIFAKRMCEKSSLSLTNFAQIFCAYSMTNRTRQVKSGEIRLKHTYEEIEQFIDHYLEIFPIIRSFVMQKFHVNFVISIFSIIMHENYNHENFLKKLEMNPDETIKAYQFKSRSNIRHHLSKYIYNKNKKGSNSRIEFEI